MSQLHVASLVLFAGFAFSVIALPACRGLVSADVNGLHLGVDGGSRDGQGGTPACVPVPSGATACPSTLLFSAGTTGGLSFGPKNAVLTDLRNTPGPVTNYENATLFTGPTLTALADFAPGAPVPAVVAPSDGAALGPWLGELSLIPSSCARPVDVTGRTVSVHFYVSLLGAITQMPSSGAFLGSYHSGEMTYYGDAAVSDVINSFSDKLLTHTFTAAEAADVRDNGLHFRLYGVTTAMTGDVQVELHVAELDWSGDETCAAEGGSTTAPDAGASGRPGTADGSTECPSTLLFSAGTTGGLSFGPKNTVLTDLMNTPGPVTNYENATLFTGPTLTTLADFVPGAPLPAVVTPSDGAALGPWLGELSLIPSTCGSVDVTGRTVSVHFYVSLLGAITQMPANGAFLGSYHSGEMTYYADAAVSDVINSFSDKLLTHAFTAAEATDVRDNGLYFRVYGATTATTGDVPVRLSVAEIDWQ
jgi:hypothetical protein